MEHDDIAHLIGRTGLGDRAAFAKLYQKTSPKLFSICLRILKNHSEAEEALQEAYVKIWRKASSFASETGAPSSWLASIARNQSIDISRARKPVSDDLDSAYDLADSGLDPERQTMIKSDGKQIDSCMDELEAERATAVRKAYVEGLSYQELAEQFGVPLNTMRTWLRRSLLKLRACMDQ